MSTVATKLMSAEEFYDWVHRPENRDRRFELDRGRIIEMSLPGKYHGFVCANVAGILRNFAIYRKKGYVCTNDAGVIVQTDPDTVRGPDIAFYEDAEGALNMERRYARTPPKLAVEVLSPEDRLNRTVRRITQLLRAGVQLVWLVDPEARDVNVYQLGKDPELFDESQEITGREVLPDLRCPVSEFFVLPGG